MSETNEATENEIILLYYTFSSVKSMKILVTKRHMNKAAYL